jgi:hypothetical protein
MASQKCTYRRFTIQFVTLAVVLVACCILTGAVCASDDVDRPPNTTVCGRPGAQVEIFSRSTLFYVARPSPSFCSNCQEVSWERYEEALKKGGNSCDGAYAYVQYCWQQCPTCRHCSLMAFFYQDTGCP